SVLFDWSVDPGIVEISEKAPIVPGLFVKGANYACRFGSPYNRGEGKQG
ncbi:hypothetical protein LCGC14_2116830, partial [marine sediment metagenome]